MIFKTWRLQQAFYYNTLLLKGVDRWYGIYDLFNALDLTHWASWGYLLSTWKQKYSLPSGFFCVVFGNSTGKIGKIAINGVKRGGVDVVWTLILCLLGVTHEWMSSVLEMFTLSWLEALPLCWRGWDVIGGFEIVIHDVWFAEDDNTYFFRVGLDDLGQLYLKERPISLTMVPISTINTNMVNNIMWEELTKIEICAIIWWIIKIFCLWYLYPMKLH